MKVNRLFGLLDWDIAYEEDFEVRIVQMRNKDGIVPLYEVEGKTPYGGWDTIYFWPDGTPTARSQCVSRKVLEEYGVRDCEGIGITQEEYEKIKEYLNDGI